LVETLCRSLSPDERASVLGDLQETHAAIDVVIRELLLLLLHRQVSYWKTWRPWLVLAGIVMPTVIVSSQISRNISAFAAMQVCTRVYSGDWFHGALSGDLTLIAVACIGSVLIVDGWCAGFVIASLSPSTLPVNAAAVVLLWLFENSMWPLRFAIGWYTVAGSFVLFIAPIVFGMNSARHHGIIRRRFVIVLAATVSIGAALAIWMDGWFGNALQRWSSGALPAPHLQARMWPFVIAGLPVVYLLLSIVRATNESLFEQRSCRM